MSAYAIYLTGASGYLGHEVAAALHARRIAFRALGRGEGIDLDDPFGIEIAWERILAREPAEPLLVHTAAMSRFGECEAAPESAWRANVEATGALASVLRRHGGRMVYISTDLVFDGEHAPYEEDDPARATSIYGRSKRGGERMSLAGGGGLVVRIPLLYGASFDGARGATDMVLSALRGGRELRLFTDEWRTPLDVRDAATRILDLALDGEATGIRHVPGPERLSRYELGVRIAEAAGLDAGAIVAASRLEAAGPPRPKDCSLATRSE